MKTSARKVVLLSAILTLQGIPKRFVCVFEAAAKSLSAGGVTMFER
jgi:hypothetical protein